MPRASQRSAAVRSGDRRASRRRWATGGRRAAGTATVAGRMDRREGAIEVIRPTYARVWARKWRSRAMRACPAPRKCRRCGGHGMQASTQHDPRRGHVPRGGRRGVRTRCSPLGTHRRARRRRPRRGPEGRPPAVLGGRQRGTPAPRRAPSLARDPPGPRWRALGELSLHPWHARGKREAGGVPRRGGDATRVTQQAIRAAGRSPPAGRRPGLILI
jgi:hypothetical protein